MKITAPITEMRTMLLSEYLRFCWERSGGQSFWVRLNGDEYTVWGGFYCGDTRTHNNFESHCVPYHMRSFIGVMDYLCGTKGMIEMLEEMESDKDE